MIKPSGQGHDNDSLLTSVQLYRYISTAVIALVTRTTYVPARPAVDADNDALTCPNRALRKDRYSSRHTPTPLELVPESSHLHLGLLLFKPQTRTRL